MDNTANVPEQVKKQQLHQQHLQGTNTPALSTMIEWKSTAKTQ